MSTKDAYDLMDMLERGEEQDNKAGNSKNEDMLERGKEQDNKAGNSKNEEKQRTEDQGHQMKEAQRKREQRNRNGSPPKPQRKGETMKASRPSQPLVHTAMSSAPSTSAPTTVRTSQEQPGGMLPWQHQQQGLKTMPPTPTPYQPRIKGRGEGAKVVTPTIPREHVRPLGTEGVGSVESRQMARARMGSSAFWCSSSSREEQPRSTMSHLVQLDEMCPVEPRPAMTSQVPGNGSGTERPVTGHLQRQQSGTGGIGGAGSPEETQERSTTRATESLRKAWEDPFAQVGRPSPSRVPEKDHRGMGIRAASLSHLQQHGERGGSPTKRPLRKQQDESPVAGPSTGLPRTSREKRSGTGAMAVPPHTLQNPSPERRPKPGAIAKPSQTPQTRKPEGRPTTGPEQTPQDEKPGGWAIAKPVQKEQVESPRAEVARKKHQERITQATCKREEEALRRKQEQEQEEAEQEAKAKLAQLCKPGKEAPALVSQEPMHTMHMTDEENGKSDMRLWNMREERKAVKGRRAQ